MKNKTLVIFTAVLIIGFWSVVQNAAIVFAQATSTSSAQEQGAKGQAVEPTPQSSNQNLLAIIEQLKNIQPLTQFGRAMEELGINILKAWSPHKGRVERLWGTLQDRLVVELRLAGAKNEKEAKQILLEAIKIINQAITLLKAS